MPGAWIVTALSFLYALVAVVFIIVPTGATIASSGVSRLTYELTQFIPLVLIVLLTIVFYILGHSDKRNQDVVVELGVAEPGVGRAGGLGGE
jgi:uncharacterized membrane protein YidH (DUF202 family)